MVRLDKIVTKAGDGGKTRLASGEPVSKASLRVEAYGAVDETNSVIGLVRLYTASDFVLDPLLDRVQHDLFDLGADLATPVPDSADPEWALRITLGQVERLEREIDRLNDGLSALDSFILPGGSPAAAAVHLARAITRRAERSAVAAAEERPINPPARAYLNRLSDLLFVLARHLNAGGSGDIKWVPGASR